MIAIIKKTAEAVVLHSSSGSDEQALHFQPGCSLGLAADTYDRAQRLRRLLKDCQSIFITRNGFTGHPHADYRASATSCRTDAVLKCCQLRGQSESEIAA